MIHIHKCLRCGHEWASKNPHPIRCPKCKSPYWFKERRVRMERFIEDTETR